MIKQVTWQSTDLYGRIIIKEVTMDKCVTGYDPLHITKPGGIINQNSL
jgi:hypothetical protein